MNIPLADEAASTDLGARLAQALAPVEDSPQQGAQLNLRGSLGAGKTTVVRGLLRSLGVAGAVRSPTYTLIEPYQAGGWHIMHYDLYRIADAEELELLGSREHFRRGVLRAVEWPERASGWLPAADLELELRHHGACRQGILSPGSDFGQCWLSALSRVRS